VLKLNRLLLEAAVRAALPVPVKVCTEVLAVVLAALDVESKSTWRWSVKMSAVIGAVLPRACSHQSVGNVLHDFIRNILV
jgi:hypothetical protein